MQSLWIRVISDSFKSHKPNTPPDDFSPLPGPNPPQTTPQTTRWSKDGSRVQDKCSVIFQLLDWVR